MTRTPRPRHRDARRHPGSSDMARMIPKAIQFRESRRRGAALSTASRRGLRTSSRPSTTSRGRAPTRRRRTIEGEADFVLVHPELGALVLEVKGGTLRYDAATDRWYQTSRGKDDEHPCADPFDQAANGARAIVEFLEDSPRRRAGTGGRSGSACVSRTRAFESRPHSRDPARAHDRRAAPSRSGRRSRRGFARSWSGTRRDQFVQGEDGAAKLVAALNHDVVIEQPLGLRAARSRPRDHGAERTAVPDPPASSSTRSGSR